MIWGGSERRWDSRPHKQRKLQKFGVIVLFYFRQVEPGPQ